MYNKEKQILVSTLGMIVIISLYSIYLYNNYIKVNPELLNDFKFWGTSFLYLIPVSIVVQIIIHIIFAAANKIITNEDLETKSDERDKLIELKAMRISHWIFILGFLTAMASQAFGMQPYVMFVVLISSMFFACIVEGIAQLYFYRRGF